MNLGQNLQSGRFRLVIVLDSAPGELVRLAGYLETVAEKLLIDLVTVSAYAVGDSKIIVPQRIDSEPRQDEPAAPVARATSPSKGVLSEGADVFENAIENAKPAERANLKRLVEWARALEKEGLVELSSFAGKSDRWILLPRLQPDNAGLVSLWNDGGPSIQYWRSMFQKRAPDFIAPIEAKTKVKIGQGNTVRVRRRPVGAAYKRLSSCGKGSNEALARAVALDAAHRREHL